MRIVSHCCSNTEILCALGYGHWLVGVDSDSDFPPETVHRVEKLGRDLHMDVARVVALRPDLVLTSLTVPGHEVVVDQLMATGLNVVVCAPKRLSDIYKDIHRIGDAIGAQIEASALVSKMRASMPPVATTGPRTKVMVEWWPKPVIAATRDSWVTDVISLAGGENACADRAGASSPITAAEALSAQPDHIIMSWCGVPLHHYRPELVLKRADWGEVQAIRTAQVHAISEAFLGRPGPRLIQGYAALRTLLGHPMADTRS